MMPEIAFFIVGVVIFWAGRLFQAWTCNREENRHHHSLPFEEDE